MLLIVLPDVSTDDDLLPRLRRGDDAAMVAVYERYFSPLYQYIRLKVGDRMLAQDIVSEVFARLMESIGRPSAPRDNLRAWLFRVARSEIFHALGKNRPHSEIQLEEWMPAPDYHDPQTDDAISMNRVRHALNMLVPEHQEVLILRFGLRLTLKETADIMGKSVAAIKSLQFRAVDTLRGILLETEANNG